ITATVKVVINPSPLPIVKSFTIEPANYEKGDLRVQRLYMKWEIENATSMHALRLVLRDGSRVDLPLEATGAYTITAPPKERGVYTYLLQPVRKYDLEVVDEPALVTVDLPPPPKITAMTITPELIQSGESAVITWTSTDASSASMSPDVGKGVVQTNGSMTIFPKYTTQYTLTVRGSIAEVGEDRSFRTIRVTSDTPQEPKIIIPDLPEPEIIIPDLPTLPQVQSDFEFGGSVPRFVAPQLKTLPSFAPQDIPSLQAVDSGKGKATQKLDLKVNGQDDFITLSSPAVFTLSWNIDTYCLAHGSWVGAKRKAGTEDIRKINSGTYTFKMYCPGVGSDEVKVKVVGGPNELGSGTGSGADADAFPTAEASISIDGEHFEKSVRVRQGEKVPVWIGAAFDVNNDGKASSDATGKWTALMSFGGRCEVNSRLARNVQQIFDMAVFDPVNVEECMVSIGEITFDKPGIHQYEVLRLVQNDGKISKSAFVNVVVDEPLPPEGPPVINLRVNGKESPATVTALTLYTISWTTRDADSCTASGMWDGEKTMNGSQTFYASTKRTFSYTLTCKGGLGTTRETLSVKVAELPQCTFGALPLVLDQESVFERESKLSWKCKFANSCEISPNTGAIVDTFGSVRVAPINTTKYTLTCSNLDGSTDFDVTVRVE
ncbi:MAG: hypothetical protein Q8R26_01700, partial [bacterium]|nr:hypothetical protein [bacterium]